MQKRTLLFSRAQKRSGFTLLELLIVLAIILVIAGMVVPNLIGSQKTANERIAYTLVKEMEKAAGNYATDHDGEYFKGNGTEAWQAMINPPAYKGRKLRPYLEEVPIDPWGNPLQYEWNGDGHSKKQNALKPAIWSTGSDGQGDGTNSGGIALNNWTPAASNASN